MSTFFCDPREGSWEMALQRTNPDISKHFHYFKAFVVVYKNCNVGKLFESEFPRYDPGMTVKDIHEDKERCRITAFLGYSGGLTTSQLVRFFPVPFIHFAKVI